VTCAATLCSCACTLVSVPVSLVHQPYPRLLLYALRPDFLHLVPMNLHPLLLQPDKGDEDCKMLLPVAYGVLVADFFIYCLIAIYLTSVLPDENGVRDNPLFFLKPSFWFPSSHRTSTINRTQRNGAPVPGRVDEDVQAEADKMKHRLSQADGIALPGEGAPPAVEVYGLQRNFGRFWAVAGSWFEIPNNQLFCLLGPNGAGAALSLLSLCSD
jgi:hypothetical protein